MALGSGYNWQNLYAGIDANRDTQNRFLAAEERDAARKQQQANADRTYELAKARATQGQQRPWWAGPGGQVDPSMLAYRKAGRPQTNVNVTGGAQEKAYDKAAGAGLFKEFAGYQTQAAGANRALQDLKLMERAIADPNLYTGTAGPTVQYLKRAANTLFGVDVRGLQSGEIVDNLGKTIALGMKDKLPGPLSNSDRDFLVSIAPGLGKSKAGNLAIIRVGMAQRQYEADLARAAMQYARQNGGRLDVNWYGIKAELDQKYSGVFGGLMDQVRSSVAGVQQPAPTTGLPQWLKGAPDSIVQRFRTAPAGTRFKSPDGQTYIKE